MLRLRLQGIGFVSQTALLEFSTGFAGAGFVATDLGALVYEFGFVSHNGKWLAMNWLGAFGGELAKFFVAFMERPFSAHAEGDDAV